MKIIFKHSPICPISSRAKREVEQYLESGDLPVDIEWIDVIADRPRSNEVADQLGIRHESPQVILLNEDGKVISHASHGQITRNKLTEMIHSSRP